MGTSPAEKCLRSVETENRFTYLPFKEALKRIRPETEGTPVPEIVSGLVCSFSEIIYQRDNGERIVSITESGAQILYNPREKASQLPAQIKLISDCCREEEAKVDNGIKSILNGLAEGPDLDLKLGLRKGVGFESVEAIAMSYFNGLADGFSEGENSYRSAEGVSLEVRKLFIPVYDFDPKKEKESSRPLLEFRFKDKNGSLILKVHLTTSPFDNAFNYMTDCRLGWSSSFKNTVCRAEVILPDKSRIQHQEPVVRLDSLVANFLSGGDNLSMSRFIRIGDDYYDILNILPQIPVRAAIGILRLMETAFLTMSDSQIVQGRYWEQLYGDVSLYDISAAFDRISKDKKLSLSPVPAAAKQEILNLWLRVLLINNPELVLETAEEIGMLDLFGAAHEDFQDLTALINRLKSKNPNPENIINDLNSFRELFSL